MATKTGTGYSATADASQAGMEAAKKALANMGSDKADIVFVFASTNYDYGKMLVGIREVTRDTPLVGCSTAGQFTEHEVGREAVVVMAVQSDSMKFDVSIGKGLKEDQAGAVKDALTTYQEKHREARKAGFNHATCIVCADGLAGHGEDLVDAIHSATGMLAQVVGGAAADDAKFQRTDVFVGDEVHTNALAIAVAFSKSPIGLGVRHGLNAACESMIVTEAKENVIYEINGQPAIKAYEAFAQKLGESFEDREAFMMTHEIGMLTPNGEFKVRAPLKANDDGSILLASEVPNGASVSIMNGTKDGLVAAAELAARSAMVNLGGARPAGVLVFDCICRRIFLGEDYRRQVDAFRSVVGDDVPIAGWETYGEIAMTPSQQTGWHNSTTVLAILPD